MEVISGLIGALVGIGLFIFGFWFGKTVFETKMPGSTLSEATEEEMAQIREEREKLIADQKAFRELMAYNPDMAYGMVENKE